LGIATAITSVVLLQLTAQVPAVKFDVRASKGLGVSPVYEGWYRVDGTTYALFGYYNRNTEEVVSVAIGSNNRIEPGPADQGQPTRFYPGRQYGVFAIAFPKDRPRTELTWTLTANGQTLAIPSFLDPLYFVSPHREEGGAYPGNTPPIVRFESSGPSAQGPLGLSIDRTAIVARPLALDVWVSDDGLPPAPTAVEAASAVKRGLSTRPQGLTLGWRVYRGPGTVSFSASSPAIEGGKARTTVTFQEPGQYVLHLTAIDSRAGTMCCWTNGYVRVAVEADNGGDSSNGSRK
jgi:hypothetical protein